MLLKVFISGAAIYMGATEWSQKDYDTPVSVCMCMHDCLWMQMCVLIRTYI